MKIIIGVVIVMVLAVLPTLPAAALDGYQYRQQITLTGSTSGAQTDYQMKFTVAYDADMQTDFDDLRFTQSDGATLVDAWLQEKTDSTSAVVWVEFPTTPADTITEDYYMYYGNSGASSNWDIRATMLDGDDFSGSSLDTNIWDSQYCTVGVSGGILSLSSFSSTGGRYGGGVLGKRLLSSPFVCECQRKSVYLGDGSHSGMSNYHDIRNRDSAVNDLTYNNNLQWYQVNDGGVSAAASGFTWSANTYYNLKMVHLGSQIRYYHGGSEWAGSPASANVPDEPMYMVIGGDAANSPTIDINWVFARKYASAPPTYGFGSEEPMVPPTAPVLSVWNNVTGADNHVALDYGTVVLFNATTDQPVTWAWTLNGVDQSTSYDNYTHPFTSGFGYYAVTVNATNSAGSALFTWGVWENMETTAETVPTFSDTSYQMLIESIDYPPDMEDFGMAMADPFVRMVGVIFYLFIFGVPLLMMYIRQDNMTLPTTLLLLFGSIIIFMLPPQWQIIAGALMTLGFVGILFKLYKERER